MAQQLLKMQFLNLLKKYFIDSEFFVSLCGTLFASFFMMEQEVVRVPTMVMLFITFWSGYLYTTFQDSQYFKGVLIANALGAAASAFLLLFYHDYVDLVKWLVIVILGLLYNSKFLDNFIRNIPLLKIFYVGLTWALINSWLILPHFHWPIFFISWLFITALVLPFDIRDMDSDEVVTFPKVMGIEATKYFAYFLVFAAMLLAIFYLKSPFSVAFFFTALATFILIYRSEPTNSDVYFSFWVELCSALPFLFSVLLKYF